MKKIMLFLVLCICFSLPVYADELPEASSTVIEPRASYVFVSTGAYITKSAYGGNCSLVSRGSGTITISVQKYASASNSWVTMAGPSSKSFSNTAIPVYEKSKTLTKGKWRCKASISAKVGSHSDSRTVYSGTLTVN